MHSGIFLLKIPIKHAFIDEIGHSLIERLVEDIH